MAELDDATRAEVDLDFRFADVPEGPATVAFWSLWLDSLSMPPLQAAVTVHSGSITDVRIGTPSLATYQRAVCGAPLAAASAIASSLTVTSAWLRSALRRASFSSCIRRTAAYLPRKSSWQALQAPPALPKAVFS